MYFRKFIIPIIVGMTFTSSAMAAVLTFEGLQDQEAVLEFYNGGTGSQGSSGPDLGISFTPGALAIIDSDDGGTGNFANEPSADTIAFFPTSSSLVMNVPGGFKTGFSFYYSSSAANSVTVYDGPNATGNVLATISIDAQYTGNSCVGDPTGAFCNWTANGGSFNGTAMSVDFGGTANQTGFDDITIGSATAGEEGEPTIIMPVPTLSQWALLILMLLIVSIAFFRLNPAISRK
jgi:hypothetical protein